MKDFEFDQYLEKVVSELTKIENGKKLIKALVAQQDFIYWVNSDQLESIKEIKLIEGNAPQNLDGIPIETDFHTYLDRVINPLISSGVITDGKKLRGYDDRKVRWSGRNVTGNWFQNHHIFNLEVGPTTYQRYSQDLHRSKTDSLKLILKGLQLYQDPYIYFSRTIGVTVIPITKNGNVYMGERAANVDSPGLLNFVAGLATFDEALDKINFYVDAQRELYEEMDISLKLDDSNSQFIGISGNPFTSETDLVFVVNTDVDDVHFHNKQWSEHQRLVCLKTKTEAENLLNEGFLPQETTHSKIAYASRFALKYLVKNHFLK
ncbi:MAG: hypothetical protein F6K58_19275 [Symploca sp. SIO2E9]|nr:hypothetical protein [Symploca sp. SIO2E9]